MRLVRDIFCNRKTLLICNNNEKNTLFRNTLFERYRHKCLAYEHNIVKQSHLYTFRFQTDDQCKAFEETIHAAFPHDKK